jgi:hypothetical protein
MSETTAYLIPQKKFEVGKFKKNVEAIFQKLNIINGYYDESRNWFNAGDNANIVFEIDVADENPPFEYVEIHDTENKRLLPEGLQERVECRNCHTDVKENLNDMLFEITEKEFNEKRETDMAAVELVCPKCGERNKLSEITYNEKTALTNQFICFVAVLDNINENRLEEIARELNTSLEIIYGSI